MLRGSAEAEAAQASTSGRGDGGVATAAAARRRRGRPRKDTKEAGAQQQGVADEWAADADLGDDSPVQLDGLPDGVTLVGGAASAARVRRALIRPCPPRGRQGRPRNATPDTTGLRRAQPAQECSPETFHPPTPPDAGGAAPQERHPAGAA